MCSHPSRREFWWGQLSYIVEKPSLAFWTTLTINIIISFLCSQKLFSIEMAEFKVQIKCMWNSETCEIEKFVDEDQSMDGNKEEEEEDDNDEAAWKFCRHPHTPSSSFSQAAAAQGHWCWSSSSSAHCCHRSGSFLLVLVPPKTLSLSWLCPPHWVLNGPHKLPVNHNIWHFLFNLLCLRFLYCNTQIKNFRKKHL